MRIISVKENESIVVDDVLKLDLMKIGADNIKGISLHGNNMKLPTFTVGEIRLENHLIKVEPLNSSLSLENIFEMFAYSENANNATQLNETNSYGTGETGFDSFVTDFLTSTSMMIDFGLPSVYQLRPSWQKKVKGVINASRYSKQLIATKGVYVKANYYSKNSVSNRIILKALVRVSELHGKNFNYRLLEPFFGVEVLSEALSSKDEAIAVTEYSSNPHHSIALAYALMLIKDLNIGYSDTGSIKWHSFLVNSNQIYERYLRTLLSRSIAKPVQKLSKPITFASNSFDPSDSKFLEPDILINYSKSSSSAQMIIDAKNKMISIKKPLAKISTNDLYQIAYYAQLFKAKSGALVYPVSKDMASIRINLRTDSQAKFYLLGINMSDKIEIRHKKFVTAVNDILRVSG